MRANTSLIGHILGSHPEINGYFEMHRSYREPKDLLQQLQHYGASETLKPGSRYLFDKILHAEYDFLPAGLPLVDAKFLVSTRHAEHSIKSIVRLFKSKPEHHPYADPQQATDYYIQRITSLADFCRQNSQHYYYFDANLIRTDTAHILSTLQRWLQLGSPLSEEYRLFRQTGKAGAGDTSRNIGSGRVVKQQSNYDEIELSAGLIARAESALRRLKPMMLENAIDSISID